MRACVAEVVEFRCGLLGAVEDVEEEEVEEEAGLLAEVVVCITSPSCLDASASRRCEREAV